ncbi:hypothetical protein LCGC14_1054380 [marine sediment metagenome]|uniref:Uncharacterized protein n=1 Tax=marine sediment metagenome TaxID=412755 RepID=A0A0F9QTX8_9ZZZZ
MAAGDITDALVDKLQIRMENPEGDKFTDTMCIKALDYSHVTVAQLLRPEYLAEFQIADTAKTMSSFKLTIATLTNTPFNYNEGIIMVKDDNSGEYLQRVHPGRLRRYENTLLAAGATNKVYWMLAGSIRVSVGGSATDNISVYYIRIPSELSTDVDPLLNSFFHNIMLNFAEAQLWATNKSLERRKVKLEEAYAQIEILNSKYTVPLGIGVTDRNR